MKSISIRSVDNFKFTEATPILVDKEKIGTIVPSDIKTLAVSSQIYHVYTAEFLSKVNEKIYIDDQLDDTTLIQKDHYLVQQSFTMYYNEDSSRLLFDAPAPVTKEFLKYLNDSTIVKETPMNFQPIQFDFKYLIQKLAETRGITFNTTDPDVTRKRFAGPNVDNDTESTVAIDEDSATFLIGKMDVLGRSRTLGFSQSSTLVIYSNTSDIEKERPELELAVATLVPEIFKVP